MNQFKNNPQQIGLNSRQLDLYQDVYVITEDGSWSEESKILIGYMVVDNDICAICRDKAAETRVCHWGTWCPASAPRDESDELARVQAEEQSRLSEAIDKMIDDEDDFSLAGRLRQIHGSDFVNVNVACPNSQDVSYCYSVGADGLDELAGIDFDDDEPCDPDPLYVVFNEDGTVEGVYRDKAFAGATVSDIGGYAIAYIGNEIVEHCEIFYSKYTSTEDKPVYIAEKIEWTEVLS